MFTKKPEEQRQLRRIDTSSTISKDTSKESQESNDTSCMDNDMKIQTLYPAFATNDPDEPIFIIGPVKEAEMILPPHSTFKGFADGFMNENFNNFAVEFNASEQWVYANLDNADSHPYHFHMTSGFVQTENPRNSQGLVSEKHAFYPFLYSRETYGVPPQQVIAFNLKFVNYNSLEGVLDPRKYQGVRGIGFCHHCHFLPHVSANSMINTYFVYPGKRSDIFG